MTRVNLTLPSTPRQSPGAFWVRFAKKQLIVVYPKTTTYDYLF
jgi:hypothetical protein